MTTKQEHFKVILLFVRLTKTAFISDKFSSRTHETWGQHLCEVPGVQTTFYAMFKRILFQNIMNESIYLSVKPRFTSQCVFVRDAVNVFYKMVASCNIWLIVVNCMMLDLFEDYCLYCLHPIDVYCRIMSTSKGLLS